jgi:hypothetical protein
VPASSLIDPVFEADICPSSQDRFELRTRTLGCGCSTTTLLSVIVAVVSTLVALLILYAILLCTRALNQIYGTGARRGWEIEVLDDGSLKGKPWARPSWSTSFHSWFHRRDLTACSEQEERTERSRLLSDHA